MVAANILNSSHRQPPAWGLGAGLTTPHHKKISLLQNGTKGLGPGWAQDRDQWKVLVNTVMNLQVL
jgi:hypothetical protein